MPIIDPTAQIHPQAQLADDVHIGAYCIIGEKVRLERGVHLRSHVVVMGQTHIKEDVKIYPFAVLGCSPQDLKYAGEESRLVVGAQSVIREHVTIHGGTQGGRMQTDIGEKCFLMVGTHIAHDCIIGAHVIMANNATLGGHVRVDEHVFIGGLAAIHQNVRIGAHAMIAGACGLRKNVIPYGFALGVPAALEGLNLMGLRRREFTKQDMHDLRHAYRLLFKENASDWKDKFDRLKQDKSLCASPLVAHMIEFIEECEQDKRWRRMGICKADDI